MSRQILSVREVNERIQAAVERSFPEIVWVRGEVQRFPPDAARRSHVYFELHDSGDGEAAAYQIPAALMGWDRKKFGLDRYLDGSDPDLQVRDELEVCFACKVDFYPPFGKLSLKVVGIDKEFSLGQLEARRRQVLAYLRQHDLVERNGRLKLPELPLRIGLITSAGSAAERDFRTGLASSPYPFAVLRVDCRMQGAQTTAQVVAALAKLARQELDVIVITRGGGSRADLSWFDQREIAVAIAQCRLPVITGIGHEIDTAIADVVAHTACKTPTAAAEFLVLTLAAAAERLGQARQRLLVAIPRLTSAAQRRLVVVQRLARSGRNALLASRLRLQSVLARLERRSTRDLAARHDALLRHSSRLAAVAGGGLSARRQVVDWRVRRLCMVAPALCRNHAERLQHLAEKARLLDPERLLARGFTLTLDAGGGLVRNSGDLAPGDAITTRFQDGDVVSVVQPAGALAQRRRKSGNEKGSERGGQEKDSGQETLFR